MVLKKIAHIEHIKGAFFEKLAQLLLILKGYRILKTNQILGGVEVDILAYKATTLIVVEVKYRQKQAAAHVAVHPSQQQRLMHQVAQLGQTFTQFGVVRLDVVLFFPHRPFVQHLCGVNFS